MTTPLAHVAGVPVEESVLAAWSPRPEHGVRVHRRAVSGVHPGDRVCVGRAEGQQREVRTSENVEQAYGGAGGVTAGCVGRTVSRSETRHRVALVTRE